MESSYRALKNGCNLGRLAQGTAPLFNRFTWHYKQWRESGTIEKLMTVLHEQVRTQVKKSPNGPR